MAGGQHHHRTNFDKCTALNCLRVLIPQTIPVTLEKSECVTSMSERFDPAKMAVDKQVWKSTINLDKLWTLVPQEVQDNFLGKENETAPVIDTLALVRSLSLSLIVANNQGYTKVLGKGRLPNTPVIVKARYVSRKAEIKIKEAGGVVELIA